jgi:hypothetical protein
VELLRVAGVGLFVLTCFAVGIRMLWLARRTRELPELALGVALLASGGLGGVLTFLGAERADALGAAAAPVRAGGLVCLAVGAGSLWVFTWRVFRPESRGAAALCAAALALLALGLVADLGVVGAPDFDTLRWQSPLSRLGFALRLGAYAWAAVESARYGRAMRRRARLGLADPELARRFLLWAVAGAAAFGIYAVAAAHILIGTGDGLGAGVFDSAWALVTAGLGLVSALCMASAFFPRAGLSPAWGSAPRGS